MGKKSTLLLLVSFLMVVPLVFAQDFSPTLVLENVGLIFQNFFANDLILFGFTVVLFFIMVYGIVNAALFAVPMFKGDHGPNKSGKIFAFAFSAIATMGIFFLVGTDVRGALEKVFNAFGLISAIILPLVAFLLIYRGFRDSLEAHQRIPLSLLGGGAALILCGAILQKPGFTSLGVLMLLIGFIWFIVTFFTGSHGDNHGAGGAHPPAQQPSGAQPPHGQQPSGAQPPHGQQPSGAQPPHGQQPPAQLPPNPLLELMQRARGMVENINHEFIAHQQAIIALVNQRARGALGNPVLQRQLAATSQSFNRDLANFNNILRQIATDQAHITQLNQNQRTLLAQLNAVSANFDQFWWATLLDADARMGHMDANGMVIHEVHI